MTEVEFWKKTLDEGALITSLSTLGGREESDWGQEDTASESTEEEFQSIDSETDVNIPKDPSGHLGACRWLTVIDRHQ
jgi:hypothetical protein